MPAAMIKAIHFKNYKCLRDTTLPLGRLTILVGPNGSGKSTALEAIRLKHLNLKGALTAGLQLTKDTAVSIQIEWDEPYLGIVSRRLGKRQGDTPLGHRGGTDSASHASDLDQVLDRTRIYSLDATELCEAVPLVPNIELNPRGKGLAGVLDRLRDEHPERWEALNEEFGRWLPEFDRILFDTPAKGERALKLRTRVGQHGIPAVDISQGTLLALAILTLAYLPEPPPIIGLEEPGRGIHPRLLRDVRDAMYRLAYPESAGEDRDPVQVVATTHSPYLLDLFRDHPEEIVIADKIEDNVRFRRLTDIPKYEEILGEAALGEVWYSGILGGVPADR